MKRREFLKVVGALFAMIGIGRLMPDTEKEPQYPTPRHFEGQMIITNGVFDIPKGQPLSDFFDGIYGKGHKIIHDSFLYVDENLFDFHGNIDFVGNVFSFKGDLKVQL